MNNHQNSEKKNWGDYDSDDEEIEQCRTPLQQEHKETESEQSESENKNKNQRYKYRTKQENKINEKGPLLKK